ncbi:MAG TPA: UDP-glucose/GDP-mannose dehydrogenase family protein, partial [Actinomycetota bacterium]|nr:UDP-glucose/GDP-mannose dehydrogenase family protein [Actinomycetota bacterium]
IKILSERGARVAAHDPFFSPEEIETYGALPSDPDHLAPYDVVVMQANHDAYRDIDWSKLRAGAIVFDGRNALDPLIITAAGAVYLGVGRVERHP